MSNVVRLPPKGSAGSRRRRSPRLYLVVDLPQRPHFAQVETYDDDQIVVRVFDKPLPERGHRKFIVDTRIEGVRLALRVGGYPSAKVCPLPDGFTIDYGAYTPVGTA